ncbi:MAG: hypothetical protein NTV39_00665 [Candidatus Saccharibacteria bacterium]|nr:hypothetical protein [Candidatus Saccharibacteria bacterium]
MNILLPIALGFVGWILGIILSLMLHMNDATYTVFSVGMIVTGLILGALVSSRIKNTNDHKKKNSVIVLVAAIFGAALAFYLIATIALSSMHD